ncbi:hypothetical protein GGI11_007739, partial [Coemansia sp. RSA 2049]
QAKKKAANKTPAGRSITRRYLKEARAALDNAYRARVVIHGEKSQRAAEAKRLLDDARKEHDAFSKAAEKKKSKKQPQQPQPQQQEAASA